MAVSNFNISDTSTSLLFKKKYLTFQENVANKKYPVLSRVKKNNELVGDEVLKTVDLGFIGGSGFAEIPRANRGIHVRASFTPKKLYQTIEFDRMTAKQSKSPGAFVETQKFAVKKATEKFTWARNLGLWGGADSTGSLGTIDTGGVTNDDPSFALVISAATYLRHRFEVNDIVNIESGNVDPFEITAHDYTTRTVTVRRLAGSQVPAQGDKIWLQNSESTMPVSIKDACDFTSGSLYGVTYQDRWRPTRIDASQGISADVLNQGMLDVHENCGESPTEIVVGYTQWRKLVSQLEDQKRYPFEAGGAAKNRKGDYSFSSIQYHTIDGGVIPILLDKMVESDRCYLLNTEHITVYDTPDSPGWVDEDGSIFLRKSTDAFEARYAAYWNTLIIPVYQGVIYNLTT